MGYNCLKRNMKKINVLILLALCTLSFFGCKDKNGADSNGYVDLGLPSGTLWQEMNQITPGCTYADAQKLETGKLPTKAQYEELISACNWSWGGSAYTITGPNGNSIILYARGKYYGNEHAEERHIGTYWTSTEAGDGVYYLEFTSERKEFYTCPRTHKCYVRAVK